MLSLRQAVRLLFKSLGFTITAVLILGFGIGANTAVFSLIEAVILNAVPYPRADRLVRIYQPRAKALKHDISDEFVDYPDYLDLCRNQRSFESLSASFWSFLDLSGQGYPERLTRVCATPSLFRVTGLPFVLGRPFTEDEDKTGGPLVVVLSEQLWRHRFNADPNIIGKNLLLSGESFQVIGVCPRQLEDVTTPPDDPVYVPMRVTEFFGGGDPLKDRSLHGYACIGRLKEGVSLDQAQADLMLIQQNLDVLYPNTDKDNTIRVVQLSDAMVATYSNFVWSLAVAVGCLLLVSSANVANLFFARALERRKETMIRATLGASRFRLMALILLEIALTSLIGGALGISIAFLSIDFIKWGSPVYLYAFQKVELSPTTLLFVLGITTLVALLAGLPPAFGIFRIKLASALREEGGRSGTASPRQQRIQSFLVVGQVALACLLLIGAGLLARSFEAAHDLPLGYNPHHLLTANITPKTRKYLGPAPYRQFFDTVLEKARRLPGVTAAAMNDEQPFEWTFGDLNVPFRVIGAPPPDRGQEPTLCGQNISPGYFETMQIPLFQGRDFNSADRPNSEKVVIVDRALAEHFFPNQNPVGKQIQWLGSWDTKDIWTIVGVVQNSRHNEPDHGLAPFQAYFPYEQRTDLEREFLLLRTQGDPLTLIPEVRRIVADLDPDVPVTLLMSFDDNVAEKSATTRLTALLAGIFSGVALFLSAVGLYGVLAYSVSQRRREIGVRIALGAQSSNILRLVIRQGLKLVLLGLAIGMIAALLLVRFIEGILYGVSGGDPITLISAASILGLTAFLACILPALRAALVNPITTLRE
jgi:putative ABC transport system permease protein